MGASLGSRNSPASKRERRTVCGRSDQECQSKADTQFRQTLRTTGGIFSSFLGLPPKARRGSRFQLGRLTPFKPTAVSIFSCNSPERDAWDYAPTARVRQYVLLRRDDRPFEIPADSQSRNKVKAGYLRMNGSGSSTYPRCRQAMRSFPLPAPLSASPRPEAHPKAGRPPKGRR
jgi:hypothetical protein